MPTHERFPREDVDFWRALCGREGDAYDELAAIVSTVATPVFQRSGASREALETLIQDVLVSVWEYTSESREAPENLRAFLYWRARGVWTAWLRHQRARELPLAELASYSCDGAPVFDALVLEELDQAFRECRAQLGEKYRRVWDARFEQDRGAQETADELGIQRAQVAVRLHRARGALEECLRRKGVLE